MSVKFGGVFGVFVGVVLMWSYGWGRLVLVMMLACSACGSAATWASAEAGDAIGMVFGCVVLGVGVGGVVVIVLVYCGEMSEVGV